MTETRESFGPAMYYNLGVFIDQRKRTVIESYLDLLPGRTATRGQIRVISALHKQGIDVTTFPFVSKGELKRILNGGLTSLNTALTLQREIISQSDLPK